MDWNKLAEALIPDENVKELSYYENKYPERNLEKGAQVTRLAPSPTGFMHLGNLYVALANERIAHQSGGVFYLRIEDTDEKRKVEGAVEVIHASLKYFGVQFDEGADLCGEYGPYYQRQRAEVYHAYAKDLIKRGLAYPCFCTEEEMEKTREYQTENKLLPGYYGEFAKCRNLTEAEIYENLNQDDIKGQQVGALFIIEDTALEIFYGNSSIISDFNSISYLLHQLFRCTDQWAHKTISPACFIYLRHRFAICNMSTIPCDKKIHPVHSSYCDMNSILITRSWNGRRFKQFLCQILCFRYNRQFL